jgi:hypothetical protein
MVTMLATLAFTAYLGRRDSRTKNRTAWWIASLVLLFCALLTKEMAVMFSALVAIYAWLNPEQAGASSFRQKALGAVIEATPYALVTLSYVLLRRHALLHSTGQFDPVHGILDVVRTLPLVL